MGIYGNFTKPDKQRFWASALAASQVLMKGLGDDFAASASQMVFGAMIF